MTTTNTPILDNMDDDFDLDALLAESMQAKSNAKEVKASRKRDEPLMATGAGMAGNIAGNVAMALPAMFVPGANTVLGAGAIGGLLGLAQPAEGGQERAQNEESSP